MKAFLMFPDRDFDMQQELPWNADVLSQDLALSTLFTAMAAGDKFLFEVAQKAVLCGTTDTAVIRHRQGVLQDCLKHPSVIRSMYDQVIEAIQRRKRYFWGFTRTLSPGTTLYFARETMMLAVEDLKKLRAVADAQIGGFESRGFQALFAMLQEELSDAYFTTVEEHLKRLKFRRGTLVSAALGQGNKAINYVLRKSKDRGTDVFHRLLVQGPKEYSFRLHPRDEGGFRALSELNDRSINQVANALAQSADHVVAFFEMLRTDLAFYIGCLNLHDQLARKGEPISFPVVTAQAPRHHSFAGLYDVCLSLGLGQPMVGNDVNADGKSLVIITGANQGGKSTFLRSIGLAQLMMQCGMFVPAVSFTGNVFENLFTHFKREEDATMTSGKFDEELKRMSAIADHVRPGSLLLFNESFAATNEREGSEIAKQIVNALLEDSCAVFFVTHQYTFARGFYDQHLNDALFLRAERERTFKLVVGEPLETSYGRDLYDRIVDGPQEQSLQSAS
jgi:DNA mismatch repair ATPase MutS